jgi:hypothetical protein
VIEDAALAIGNRLPDEDLSSGSNSSLPALASLSTGLKQFTSYSLKAVVELNSQLVVENQQELVGLNEVIIDLDGTVIITKVHLSWAFKDYTTPSCIKC